ncbi:MAG: hypothetical protein FJ267_11335 [Planctomycetes bacterium]|nr:hypothetical protein [Planctomycetota bacterium]
MTQVEAIELRLANQRGTTALALTALEQIGQLHDQVLTQSESVPQASEGLKKFVTLKSGLIDAAQNLETAQSVSGQLISLGETLSDNGAKVDVARTNAEGLIEMNRQLANNDLDLSTSQNALAGLFKMQEMIATQSRTVAQSVQSLEILSGFHDEFVSQIQIFAEMRRNLIEISLMDSTVQRVTRLMKPLIELSNLRSLSDDELRSAARTILDNRSATRISTNSSEIPYSSNRPYIERKIETDLNLGNDFKNETSNEGLVPLPDDVE